MAQLEQRLALDLPDPLAGDAELLTDLLQRAGPPVGQAEAQLDDRLLPVGQLVQHVAELLLEQQEGRGVDRDNRVHVLDEVTQVGVVGRSHRGVQRHRLASQALDLDDLGSREVQGCAELLRGRLATELLEQLALQPNHLVDRLDHVDGDADGAALVGDRPGDGLPDPPRGVR